MHYYHVPVHLLVSRSSVAQAGRKTRLDPDFNKAGLKERPRVRLRF